MSSPTYTKNAEEFYQVEENGNGSKATVLLEHWRSVLCDPGKMDGSATNLMRASWR